MSREQKKYEFIRISCIAVKLINEKPRHRGVNETGKGLTLFMRWTIGSFTVW